MKTKGQYEAEELPDSAGLHVWLVEKGKDKQRLEKHRTIINRMTERIREVMERYNIG